MGEVAMAGRDAYLDHLASVPLFAACSRKELQTIARASDELSIPAGRVLVEQGQTGRECFVILEGSATVKRNNRKVATLGPGSYFGELSLLDKGPRTATVTADTALTVLVLGPREFSSVLEQVPGLAHKLLASLAARVRDLDTKAFG
jgi:CRP-like cAMP-binding protein